MMRLLKQEWKKMLAGDRFLLVFILCFIAVLLMLWYRVYHISYGDDFYPSQYREIAEELKKMPEAKAEEYLAESEEDVSLDSVKRVVREEWSSVCNYKNYLNKIRQGVSSGLQGLGENVYQKRLQKRYQSEYKALDADRVSFVGGRGVSLFCHTDLTDMMAALLLLLLVFRLLVWESETGMGCISAAARNGASCLTRTKWLAGMMVSVPLLLVFFLYKLFLYIFAYGFSEWGGAVQSLPEFMGVSKTISIACFVAVFLIYKIIGFLFLYTIFFCLALVGQNTIRVVVLEGIFASVSLFLFYGIPLSGSLAVFRYFSPLQCVNQEMLLSGFRAIKLFQYPISYLRLWQAFSFLVFLVLLCVIFRSSVQKEKRFLLHKPWFRSGKFRYCPKKCQRLFCWEGRKGLFYGGGIYILLLAGMVVFLFYQPPRELIYTSEEYYYRELMQELEGKYSDEKRNQIQDRIAELEKLEADVAQNGQNYTATAMQVAESELKHLDVFREVGEYMDYLSQKENAYIVYEKGYLLLLGEKIPGGYLRLCSILAVVLMVLMAAKLWGEDAWYQTEVICRASRAGIKKVVYGKKLWNILYAILIGAVVYIPWIYECGQTYSLKAWSAAAGSLLRFHGMDFVTLGEIIICSYVLRILYLVLVGWVTKIMQKKLSSQSLTVYASLILCLLPVFLFS